MTKFHLFLNRCCVRHVQLSVPCGPLATNESGIAFVCLNRPEDTFVLGAVFFVLLLNNNYYFFLFDLSFTLCVFLSISLFLILSFFRALAVLLRRLASVFVSRLSLSF